MRAVRIEDGFLVYVKELLPYMDIAMNKIIQTGYKKMAIIHCNYWQNRVKLQQTMLMS